MALVTLEEYKEYYKISSAEGDDRLSSMIDLVSELVEVYLSRNIASEVYSDVYLELLGSSVYTPNFPIESISLLEYFDKSTETWVAIDSANYFVEEDNGIIEILDSSILSLISGKRRKPVRVSMTAGYSIVPSDLKLAVFDLITYYNKRQQTPVRNMSGQGVDTTAGLNGSEMPAHIKRVLSLHRLPA